MPSQPATLHPQRTNDAGSRARMSTSRPIFRAMGRARACQVVNISADGAAIDVPDPVFIPNRFQLMTEKDRVVRDCRVVWTKQNRIGVIFE